MKNHIRTSISGTDIEATKFYNPKNEMKGHKHPYKWRKNTMLPLATNLAKANFTHKCSTRAGHII